MDDARARALLGVGADASPAAVRDAYRRLLRRHHPDVAGASPAATRRTAELNRAYAWLVQAPELADQAAATATTPGAATPGATAPDPPAPAPSFDMADDADAEFPVEAATLEVFNRLCEAADTIGALSYVDRANAILETIISPEGGPTCSLMVTLQARGDETLAYCTLESLDSRPGPPIDEVVGALTRALD